MTTSVAAGAGWARVGDISPLTLADARLQLHHAAQIVVSAAISYVPARPDDSHTALSWSAPIRALVGEPMTVARPLRIALGPEDLTLHALDGAASGASTFALDGRTIADAYAWLTSVVSAAGLDPARLTSRKHYTIPTHRVADGSAFTLGSGKAFAELGRYWSNAAMLLEALARETPGASEVRCWPHHFDIATLITLRDTGDAPRRTMGIGHSPGDEWYAEPYWYVGPSPHPDPKSLPPLDGNAHWHTMGWFGAVLAASDYVRAAAGDQHRRVAAFVESAVAACRRLLGEARA